MNVVRVIIMSALVMYTDAPGKIKVACIGNSITAGYGLSGSNSNYPARLQNLLGNGYEVQNDGVSGTTMLKTGDNPYWKNGKLNQALAFKPDIITIKLGTNDTKARNWDIHYDEFKKDYLSMIDTLSHLSTKPDIFLVAPVPVFKNNYGIRDSILQLIIGIVEEIAKERTLPVIDANTPFLGHSNYFSDGVHPNAAGADTLAHIIYRSLIAATGSVPMVVQNMRYIKRVPSFSGLLQFDGRSCCCGTRYSLMGRKMGFRGSDGEMFNVSAGLYIAEFTVHSSGSTE